MSNRAAHASGAMLLASAAHALLEERAGRRTMSPLLTAVLASQMGSLPDVLEPATSPNHRDFFHSVAFGALVAVATVEAFKWVPTDPAGEILRILAIAAGGSYVTHLGMDATTPRSIPLLGGRRR